jgi:hypothetical protein
MVETVAEVYGGDREKERFTPEPAFAERELSRSGRY